MVSESAKTNPFIQLRPDCAAAVPARNNNVITICESRKESVEDVFMLLILFPLVYWIANWGAQAMSASRAGNNFLRDPGGVSVLTRRTIKTSTRQVLAHLTIERSEGGNLTGRSGERVRRFEVLVAAGAPETAAGVDHKRVPDAATKDA